MVEFLVEGNGDYIDLHNCCLQLKINELTLSHPHYGYRAIMETLLTYSSHAEDTWLQSGNYYKDTGGAMDTLTNVNA